MKNGATAYQLGALVFHSELPLPELLEYNGEDPPATPPVNIRMGRVPFFLPGGIEVDPDCIATGAEYLLRVPGVACYRVSNGREVILEPAPGALPLDVRAYLLGTIFAVLCHQRGLLPLHASAVDAPHGVTAFLGASGQGKSSLAAALVQRGFLPVADDICLIDNAAASGTAVIPAAPWLKLWRGTLEQMGRSPAGLERVFSEDDKYRLPLDTAAQRAAHPKLHRLVFLDASGGSLTARAGDRADSGSVEPNSLQFRSKTPAEDYDTREVGHAASPWELATGFTRQPQSIGGAPLEVEEQALTPQPELRPLSPLQALPLLLNCVHQAYLLKAMGKREATFMRCAAILSQAKSFLLIRPWGFAHLPRTADLLDWFLREP